MNGQTMNSQKIIKNRKQITVMKIPKITVFKTLPKLLRNFVSKERITDHMIRL